MNQRHRGLIAKLHHRAELFELLARRSPEFIDRLQEAAELLVRCLEQGGKILICGNGGSAAQSAHFAAELVNRFRTERPALAALCLASDIPVLSSIANDYDYRFVFSRQLEALAGRGDVLLTLTTSGRSPNILEAHKKAEAMGISSVCLCGPVDSGRQETPSSVIIPVPAQDTALIQEVHLFMLHYLAEVIEIRVKITAPSPSRSSPVSRKEKS